MDWVEAVGFQKEALHVGVLKHLLTHDRAVDVARALAPDAGITDINKDLVHTEARIGGAHRPIDLGARVTAAGEEAWLGVEVKVDSAWSPRQLQETLPEGVAGVLLALGRTAIAVEDDDMRAIEPVPWRCVRPAELASIVRDNACGDKELLSYADRLDREACEHEAARIAVRDDTPVVSERDATALGHWAYFSEVVRIRKDTRDWERKALISGPLMTLWVNGDQISGDYLEFMGERDRRSLCVKTYAPPVALLARREQLVTLLTDHPHKHDTPRLLGGKTKTCTAARFDLDAISPKNVADLVDDLVERLKSGARPAAPASQTGIGASPGQRRSTSSHRGRWAPRPARRLR